MPRRIEIELTSSRDDGTWTWRAAGAKEPRGTMAASLLPQGAKSGDVLRVEAEFYMDGIEVTSVVPGRGARQEPERIELLASPTGDEPLVTSTLAPRGRDDRRPRRDGPRRDRPRREGAGAGARPGDRGDHSERPERRDADRPGRRRDGGQRPPRRTRPEPPPMPAVERPKAKRLRAGRTHRTALLDSLPDEQRPVAEQVVLGGLPAVRQAIAKQNEERTAAGESPIAAGPLLELAEKLVPKVRAAEWRDRAEAARRDLDQLDLRDLRSVVSAADAAPKDEAAKELVTVLKAGLATRVDAEHSAWLEELTATLDVGRVVRALRVSSRPPKAGSPLPADLAARLTADAGAALTAEAAPERWVAILDALAFSPVRDKVIPASLPKELHPDVQGTIARLATRIPKVAHIFEIAPDPTAARPKPERRRPKRQKPRPEAGQKQAERKVEEPKAEDVVVPEASPEAAGAQSEDGRAGQGGSAVPAEPDGREPEASSLDPAEEALPPSPEP